jgi:hypothetical protein
MDSLRASRRPCIRPRCEFRTLGGKGSDLSSKQLMGLVVM